MFKCILHNDIYTFNALKYINTGKNVFFNKCIKCAFNADKIRCQYNCVNVHLIHFFSRSEAIHAAAKIEEKNTQLVPVFSLSCWSLFL